MVENWYNFFTKCLVEFNSEPLWALFRKFVNYWFNFFNKCNPNQIIIFLVWVFGGLHLSRNWPISSTLSTLSYSQYFFIILLVSMESIVDIPSFISIISNLHLLSFFLNWPGYRLINFINLFFKNQLFVLYIFSINFHFSMPLIFLF